MNSENLSEHRELLLWTALIAPAFGWFAQLTVNYTLATYACANDRMWILHSISVVALVLAGMGIWSGWRCWRIGYRPRREPGRGTVFYTAGTLLLATMFLLGILANELSNWMLEPCL